MHAPDTPQTFAPRPIRFCQPSAMPEPKPRLLFPPPCAGITHTFAKPFGLCPHISGRWCTDSRHTPSLRYGHPIHHVPVGSRNPFAVVLSRAQFAQPVHPSASFRVIVPATTPHPKTITPNPHTPRYTLTLHPIHRIRKHRLFAANRKKPMPASQPTTPPQSLLVSAIVVPGAHPPSRLSNLPDRQAWRTDHA